MPAASLPVTIGGGGGLYSLSAATQFLGAIVVESDMSGFVYMSGSTNPALMSFPVNGTNNGGTITFSPLFLDASASSYTYTLTDSNGATYFFGAGQSVPLSMPWVNDMDYGKTVGGSLSWSNISGALSYNLYSSLSGDLSWNSLPSNPDATAITSPFYIDGNSTNLSSGTYYFTVLAVFPDGNLTMPGAPSPPLTIEGGGGGVPCFLASAPVLTPDGYRRISSIKVGDLVTTPEGKAVPVQRVKVTEVDASPAVNPYVIAKGQFGATKELLISPNHRVLTEGRLVEACQLGLAQHKMSGSFTYYNLELPAWAKMVVAGVTVESLAPKKRVVMTMSELKTLLIHRYGAVTPAALASIKRTVRLLENGKVEVPVLNL
jgi:hypothetical protein